MDNLFKPENPDYVPMAIPRVGVRMEFQRANLVVRDESGKELWMGPVVVERVLDGISFGVVMSAATAENMLAAVAIDSGMTPEMYQSMLVHDRESTDKDEWEEINRSRAAGSNFEGDSTKGEI